jgi:HEAT repeat protein
VLVSQVDYQTMLAREEGQLPDASRRDDVWQSIVKSIASGDQTIFDERAQQRLLAIAGSPADIVDLSGAVMAPKCAVDGSPMLTSQAATVLAAFRHLTGIVTAMSPERVPDVMGNLATAATRLDPHVVMQLMQGGDEKNGGAAMVASLAGAFDDLKVAQLLATALALDGKASDRLATIFSTIAPDEDRRQRVMTLTRNLLSETDFGKPGQFQALWTSMEELLVSYDDKPFVSEAYRTALDRVGGRAEEMAALELPSELPAWMDSLGQENVRSLSVLMLVDLFVLERDQKRAAETASDLEALAEDLLMSGAYEDALMVIRTLDDRAKSKDGPGRDACRLALDRLGESLAMREAAALAGEVDDEEWDTLKAVMCTAGITSVEAVKPLLSTEQETLASERAAEVVLRFGALAVGRLAPLVGDSRWFVQKRAAQLLGRVASPEAVPLLQPLLRQGDPRVARAAVSALGAIDDPAAARAVQTVLRAAGGDSRRAVIDALVADRDERVVPMLLRMLNDSEPLGKDHDVALETIAALGHVGSEQAVSALSELARTRAFFGRRRVRAVKHASVTALGRIGTARAQAALRDAAQNGDRMLKKIVAARG